MLQVALDQDREARRAMALASLREGWRLAKAAGYRNASDDEIDAEIDRICRTPEGRPECAQLTMAQRLKTPAGAKAQRS